MDYKVVIGLEVHVELLTRTKMFCACSTEFGAPPNSHVCPACLGLPGSLPVPNQEAVTQAIRAALALNCRINQTSIFARKNYFYPDLPKGYQITQTQPLAESGSVDIGTKTINISRLHIEEDSGKLIHTPDSTLVDFNRSGIPLAEIVTQPCISSPSEAKAFLETLKQVLEYGEVSDCKMEEGSLRCDANISLQELGSIFPGTRTEIKNLNSFRSVEKSLEYEIQRQRQLLEQGAAVNQQTLRWDEDSKITKPMRSKVQALDYRYFPEPDLPPLVVENEAIQEQREMLPEFPQARKARFMEDYALSEYDADGLTRTRAAADWFEQTVSAGALPREAAQWVMGEIPRLLSRDGLEIGDIPFEPSDLARLIELAHQNVVSGMAAKQVLAQMFTIGGDPAEIIRQKGLDQVNDPAELRKMIEIVLFENPDSIKDFHAGKDKALGYLMGQAMKLSRGRANPVLLRELFERILRK